MSLFKRLFTLNEDKKFYELESYLIYLSSINETYKINETQEAYESIVAIQIMIKYANQREKSTELLFKYNLTEKFLVLIDHLCQIRKQLDFEDCKPVIDPVRDDDVCYKTTTLNERRIFNLINLETIFNHVLATRLAFQKRFTMVNKNKTIYLKTYLTFIGDLDFMKSLNEFCKKGIFIVNLGIIAKEADESLQKWRELNSLNPILEFGLMFKEYLFDAYNIVSYVLTDKDIENLSEICQIIEKYVQFACNAIEKPFRKTKSIVKDIDKQEKHFHVNYILDDMGFKITAVFLLKCLYRLSVNDALKMKIYRCSNLKACLKKFLFNGIDLEKDATLQLLAQLAFNQEINNELNSDHELVTYIETLNKKNEFTFKKLENTIQEILFILRFKNSNINRLNTYLNHIMISYSVASRDICLKIKQELEKQNFTVWMDENEMHGKSLEPMARAVDQASCVLIFVSEKYRQSVSCQAEAQYASSINKPIIPCIVQQGYQNVSGWLGMIISEKKFIDFTRKFEEPFKRLIKQIELNQTNTTTADNSTVNLASIKEVKEDDKLLENSHNQLEDKHNNPEDWTSIEVENWFLKNNLKQIFDYLKPINGKDLYQLYEIKMSVPEFFFKSLTKQDSFEIKEIMYFSKLLVELFRKS